MLLNLMIGWLSDTYAARNHSVTPEEFVEHYTTLTNRFHFSRHHFISQGKHGLGFALPGDLEFEEDGLTIGPIEYQVDDPNSLLYFLAGNLTPVLGDTAKNNGLTRFEQRIHAFNDRLSADKARLDITEPDPAITVFREAGAGASS